METTGCLFSSILLFCVCMSDEYTFTFFSPSDVNWTWVDDQTKQEIGLQAKDDGEFWMSYRDFCKQFQELTICQCIPEGDRTEESVGKLIC